MAHPVEPSTDGLNAGLDGEPHQQHFHAPTVEDVPDEENGSPVAAKAAPLENPPAVNGTDGTTMSAKAAGKQRMQASPEPSQPAPKSAAPAFTEEAFPTLGPAKPAPVTAGWGSRPNFTSTPIGAAKNPRPTSARGPGPASANIPSVMNKGQDSFFLPRSFLKPLPKGLQAMVNDVTQRSNVKLDFVNTMQNDEPGLLLRASGPSEAQAREKIRALVSEIGKREQEQHPIPTSVRSQIIGKGGETIKRIQQSSGARVQMPQMPKGGDTAAQDEDETINITLEGDPLSRGLARNEIAKILQRVYGSKPPPQRAPHTVKDIPPEFFPFLRSQRYHPELAQHQTNGIDIDIPHYQTYQVQPPAARPQDFVPRDGHQIRMAGEPDAVAKARASMQSRTRQLQEQLAIDELLGIESNKHQIVFGPGFDPQQFVEETGCSLILPPPGDDSETIYVVGPPERLEQAKDKAIDLSSSMMSSQVDVAKQYQGPREQQAQYLRNVSRYLQQRQALEELTRQHNAQVSYPSDPAHPLTLWTRDPRTGVKARQDAMNLISGHPHQRFRNVNVHPFYQRQVEEQHARHLREQHGVQVLASRDDTPEIMLVVEDRSPVQQYAFPRRRPQPDEVAQFEQALQEAEQYLLQAIGEQQTIVSRQVDAPSRYREKLSRFANRNDSAQRYPVQYGGLRGPVSRGESFPVTLQGPGSEVDEGAAALLAFIEEQIRDEAERGHQTTCTFPKELQGRLVGREGVMIKKLSEDFDVKIDTAKEGDQVTITGPPAKAERAKKHIMEMAKQAQDETTHQLRIDPQFHAELIGKGGSNILRYQDKYGVDIRFPKSVQSPPGDADAVGQRRRATQAPNEVLIKGPSRGANAARDDLWDLFMSVKNHSHEATVLASPEYMRQLIGARGTEAESLRSEHDVRLDFPNSSDPVDSTGRQAIKVRGPQKGVEAARRALEARINVLNDTVTERVPVGRKHYNPLIGPRGENLKQMISVAGGDPSQSARIVQIPKSSSTDEVIVLNGSRDVVNSLMRAINDFVAVRDSQVADFIEVPPDRHGAIIGAAGAVKKSIQDECNVIMQIPDRTVTGPARSEVKLIGQPADIVKAKERITSIIGSGKPAGETVQMPIRLHHTIADNGKMFQILRRNMGVNVDHNRQRPPPRPQPPAFEQTNMPLITDGPAPPLSPDDVMSQAQWRVIENTASPNGNDSTIPWILKGDTDDVAKAKEMIEAAMAAAENSITGYLLLPQPGDTHVHVIGPKGSTISSIRETTGVNPNVPKAGVTGPIQIVGPADKVEEAKEAILQAVMEGLSRGPRGGRGMK